MLNKNRIKTVLYVNHTRETLGPIKKDYNYQGHAIKAYSVGHGMLAKEIFQENKINILLEDSTDSTPSKICIEELKAKYCPKAYHRFVEVDKEGHIQCISGKTTEDEKDFLDGLINFIIKECREEELVYVPQKEQYAYLNFAA